MDWRLGLDLGTNSIGWAAVALLEGKPEKLLDLGSRIFTDGRTPGRGGKMGDPLAVERRLARGARRLRERRWRRVRSMHALMVKAGYLRQEDLGTDRKWRELNPYQLRAEALERPLSGKELARVLVQLSRRRGFQSNRKDAGKSADEEKQTGILKAQTHTLERALGALTLGQFFWKACQEKRGLRFKKGISEFYPSRQMYRDEFVRIRDFQIVHHPAFDWVAAEQIVFFQRPLRPVERGKCTFYLAEFRAFKHQPSSHHARIAQELLNLKKVGSIEQIPLTRREFDLLYSALDKREKMTFNQIRKELGGIHDHFNLESESRDSLQGNTTACKARKLIGEKWDSFSIEAQDAIVETLIVADDAELISALERLGLNDDEARSLSAYTPANGTTSISARFQRDCLRLMVDAQVPYFMAVEKLGYHHSDLDKQQLRERLPYYGEVLRGAVMGARPDKIPVGCANSGLIEELTYGKINNPTVHIALRQTQRLVNRLVTRFGPPAEIVLELARELKMGTKAIDEIIKKQALNQKEREAGKVLFAEAMPQVHMSDADHKKYRLWKELDKGQNNHQCLYCGRTIGGQSLFSGEAEVEHILPYSRTLDNSFSNTTLAHRSCNQFKGNRTPFEAFGNSPAGYTWSDIYERAKRVGKERKFHPEAMKKYEEGAGFIDRQLTDTAYMTKVTKQYLSCLTPGNKIWSSPGQLTAELRARWGFNTLLNRGSEWHKNRTDHRHHAVDALVIALTDRSTLQEVAKLNGQNREFRHLMPPCPLDRTKVEERLRTVHVSHKPDHGFEGKLYKETALGRVKTLVKLDLKNPADLKSLKEKDLRTVRPHKIREFLLDQAEQFKKGKTSRWFGAFLDRIAERYTHLVVSRWRYVARASITDWGSWQAITESWADRFQVEQLRNYLADEGHFHPENLGDKALKEQLERYAKKTGIQSIRYEPKDRPDEKGIASAPFKFYSVEDYFCVDIWATPVKGKQAKYEGIFVSRIEAYRNKAVRTRPDTTKKPHPAARYVMRLFKKDIVQVEYQGNTIFAMVTGLPASQGNKLDLKPIYCAEDVSKWLTETNSRLISGIWSDEIPPRPAINVLFASGRMKVVHISEDGQLLDR